MNRQIYPDINYGGVVDDYIFDFIQEGFKHIEECRMFTGDKHGYTLCEKTLKNFEKIQLIDKLLVDIDSLEDRIGEVYGGE